MPVKKHMIDLIADIIAEDDGFKTDHLNDEMIWNQFMDEVLNQMNAYPDETIRHMLQSIEVEDFQLWIDDPSFWDLVNGEVEKKVMICKKMFSRNEDAGHC